MNHHGSKVSISDSELPLRAHETRVREQNQDETLKVLHPSNKRLDIIGTITVNGQVMFP